jgi:hypothetical protein
MSSIIRSRRREAEASHRGGSPRRVAAAALAALFGLWAPAAGAEVLLFSARSNQEQNFSVPVFLDLNGSAAAGGTALTFATTQANQRVAILLVAACNAIGDDPGESGYVVAEIRIDPAGPVGEIALPPTNNGGSLLCVGTLGVVNGVGATVVASARPFQAGSHPSGCG